MIGRHQVIKRAEPAQQLLRQLHHVHAGQPGAQENGQQFCVGQRRRPCINSFSRGASAPGQHATIGLLIVFLPERATACHVLPGAFDRCLITLRSVSQSTM